MKTYTTGEVAGIIGLHVNTVRLYEDLELIAKPKRRSNGYRVFTEEHLAQFRLARTAFAVEVLQSGLRKEAIDIVKTAACREYTLAQEKARAYRAHILEEQKRAEEAIRIAQQMLAGETASDGLQFTRTQTIEHLQISIDTLRNWERNGLLAEKRKQNGYRIYSSGDIRRLKLIRMLRCANYSLEAILRMLYAMAKNPDADIRTALNTPQETEEIISVGDRLLVSLHDAEQNAKTLEQMLEQLK